MGARKIYFFISVTSRIIHGSTEIIYGFNPRLEIRDRRKEDSADIGYPEFSAGSPRWLPSDRRKLRVGLCVCNLCVSLTDYSRMGIAVCTWYTGTLVSGGVFMGVFLLRGILYMIYSRIASRIPNKREILRLSRRIVRATRNFPVREIEQNCTFILRKRIIIA